MENEPKGSAEPKLDEREPLAQGDGIPGPPTPPASISSLEPENGTAKHWRDQGDGYYYDG